MKHTSDISLICSYFEELLQFLILYKIPPEIIIFDTCILTDNLNYHSGFIFDVIHYEELEFTKKKSTSK